VASCGLQLVTVQMCECAFELLWSAGCNQLACVETRVSDRRCTSSSICNRVWRLEPKLSATAIRQYQYTYNSVYMYICTHTEKRVWWGMLNCAADGLYCRCCVCKTLSTYSMYNLSGDAIRQHSKQKKTKRNKALAIRQHYTKKKNTPKFP